MAGLIGGALGWQDNPWYKGFDQNRNAISRLGVGFMQGKGPQQGLEYGAEMMTEGATLDRQERQRQEELAKQQQAKNYTAEFLRGKGRDDLAGFIENGAMTGADAYNQWYQESQPKGGDAFTLGAGETRYGPNGEVIATGQPKPEAYDAPTIISIYDENGREQKGYMTPDGFVPVGDPKAETPRNEFNVSQANAAGYADRMVASDALLDQQALVTAMQDPGNYALGKVPFGNYAMSQEYQQAEQAQRDFINAVLRRESGAVISDSEFENARKQYFPQPGDTPAVIAQKAANRKNTINGVIRSAGPAYGTDTGLGLPDDPLGIR